MENPAFLERLFYVKPNFVRRQDAQDRIVIEGQPVDSGSSQSFPGSFRAEVNRNDGQGMITEMQRKESIAMFFLGYVMNIFDHQA